MSRSSTLFLRGVIYLIGLPVLTFSIFGLFWLVNHPANPDYAGILYPIAAGMFGSVIPFFIALYQALKLLSYIDQNHAFSDLSVQALKKIKYCAAVISVLYLICLPFFYFLAEKDDAPGLVIIGMVLAFAPIVIAVFAAVLERLLHEAILIKTENELTV